MGTPPEFVCRKYILLGAIITVLLAITPAVQAQDAVVNYHSGNKMRLVFSADGQIGVIGSEPGMEWPIGTGREYLELAFPVLLEGRKPISFSANRSLLSPSGGVAMSHLEESWPQAWNGQWDGFRAPGRLTSDQESVLVMDASNSTLQMKIRGLQWSQFLVQDMIVLHYTIQNTGPSDLNDLTFGFVVDPAIGGDGDDQAGFNRDNGVVTITDLDGIGHGRGIASAVGDWAGVGRLSLAFIETPGIDSDGIDNDGDGLIDESRNDGIDNDGDWNPDTDDLGADGRPDTADPGESDGIPTAGEPHFDSTDIDESDEVGVSSFSILEGASISRDDDRLADLLTPGSFDSSAEVGELVLGSGPFSIPAGESRQIGVVLYLSENELDQGHNDAAVSDIRRRNYMLPIGPPRPRVTSVRKNNEVTLYWDNRAEATPGFQGYKIFRSTDPGFNSVYTVTDNRGNLIYSKPEETFDLNDGISGLFGVNANGFRYFLGDDSGLAHWWTDTGVTNGRTYFYAVVAYKNGDLKSQVFPSESTKSIVVQSDGTIITDLNTAQVLPTAEAVGFTEPDFAFDHASGDANGSITADIIDRNLIKDKQYRLTFDVSNGDQTSYTLTDLSGAMNTIINRSTAFSTPSLRNEQDPQFDGLRMFVIDSKLKWDPKGTLWKEGDSNWQIDLQLNSNLGPPTAVAADYEVRFGPPGFDTAIFTSPIPVPFQVWNITENRKENILVLDGNGNGAWDSGEPVYIVKGTTISDFRPVYWTITLTSPTDPAITPVDPEAGDLAFIPTIKPFSEKDSFILSTSQAGLSTDPAAFSLDEIATVPNPFILSSGTELSPRFTSGDFNLRMQFIHLPQRCTIKIFTVRGQLVDTIEHDASIDDGTAYWDLRTRGRRAKMVAPGVYLYHVQAPGIGETVGRFAVIR